jgi:dethiobiotin synthetase
MRLVVTGTDTGVGKTWASAALARPGDAYVKAAQTGDDDDAATVRALSGADVHTLARYPEPLAPATAARRAGMETVSMVDVARFVESLPNERVIVEGAGGLLVHLDAHRGTIADVADLLDAPVIVVARAGLGTLNHTALTVEALERRNLRCLGVIIGAWPRDPDLAAQCNLEDLAQIAPVLGRIPEGEFTTMEIPA